MGVPSVTGQELRALATPSVARTPSGGAPESAPKEAARVAPVSPQPTQADAASSVESAVQRGGTRLRVDDGTKRIVAQILDENREVIKQIPPEDLLQIAARLRQLEGLLFDSDA
ncbi:MAG: flagellar protein FlaG [Candidatus Hydrogenedentes bacterium]|nr:flagellar protein FlaG [Candidatus Hydrogenedentota bacterium]